MSCIISTPAIQPYEYIGNSLETINSNFANLRDGVQNNCTNILSATNVLSNLQTIANTLQQYAQGRVKAWVVFDGTKDINGAVTGINGDRYLYTPPYNIFNVFKVSTGIYNIEFAEEIFFPEPEDPTIPYPYGVLVTVEFKQATPGNRTVLAQPVVYAGDYVSIEVHDGQPSPVYADPERVTVAII